MFQIWKRIKAGRIPDCTRRISNNMEHNGRLLGSYVPSDQIYLILKGMKPNIHERML